MHRDMNDCYRELLNDIMTKGKRVMPRGKLTLEIPGHSIRLPDMRKSLITMKERGLNYRFAVAEFVWMIAAKDQVAPLVKYNSKMQQFSDDGIKLAGAYGPRFMPQWRYAFDSLLMDPDSRQAVMSIWSPNPGPSKDIPCTLTFQFLIRDGYLNMIVNMRSSDAWLGIPYDVFTFSNIGCLMCYSLAAAKKFQDLKPGFIQLNLGSSHLYEEHFEAAAIAVHKFTNYPDEDLYGRVEIPRISYVPHIWQLNAILEGHPNVFARDDGWKVYQSVLASKTSLEGLEVLLGSKTE